MNVPARDLRVDPTQSWVASTQTLEADVVDGNACAYGENWAEEESYRV